MFLDKIALALAIIGGLNWGSIGIFQFDLVAFLFGGQASTFSRIWCITLLFRDLRDRDHT